MFKSSQFGELFLSLLLHTFVSFPTIKILRKCVGQQEKKYFLGSQIQASDSKRQTFLSKKGSVEEDI